MKVCPNESAFMVFLFSMFGKNIILVFVIVILTLTGFAQHKVTVSGSIIDAVTKQPVLYANIAFPELGIGTYSNSEGRFTIKNVPLGTHRFVATYIGYKEYSIPMTLNKDVELKIRLQKQSLGLREIVVTAENSESGTTSSKINNEAIDHVQASSLKDIMQLVPGNLAENPDLSKAGKVAIREVEDDVNSALGTSIIIDDIPLSNDGNLQNTIKSGGGFESTAGTGIDIRQISVENIESITVDVGIPSAEHGNLTSGAVRIKTKTCDSPYTVKLQTDPYTKQGYLNKGYLLGNDAGILNIDFGYTESYKHLEKQTDLFRRLNGTAKYNNTFLRQSSPLHVEAKLDYTGTIDGQKYDQDMLAEEEHHAEDQTFRGKLSANWSLNKSWITNVSADIGYSQTHQEGFEKTLESSSSGPNFFFTATESGEYEIFYGPPSYYSEVTYDGKPFSFYSKLKAKLLRKSGTVTNNILIGTEWRTIGNNGDGRIFDLTKPPAGEEGNRPRPFSEIPNLNQFSLFAEDKVSVLLGSTDLNLMAGIRMDNIQPSGPFTTDGSISFDPRLNLKYQILNRRNNKILRDLSIRLGYGQNTKTPTLTHLYPDKAYRDKKSFNYYPNLMVGTTYVVEDTKNYELNPSQSKKYEAGVDFQIDKIKTRITGFYEKHTSGYFLDQIQFPMHYRKYNVLEDGHAPYYIEGKGVYYTDPVSGNPIELGFSEEVTFKNYKKYHNASNRIKKGIEYNIDFGKIKPLRTSFVVNGAWLNTESYSTDTPYWELERYLVYNGNTSEEVTFAVKYPDRYGYGVVKDRFNTNFTLITHIPEIKMLVSITTQVIWHENDSRKMYDNYKFYNLNELRDYLNQPDLFKDHKEETFYYFLPVGYKEYDNIEKPYSISDFEDPIHQSGIKTMYKYRFTERKLPPLVLCNIKISKDLGERFKLSFYANNFLNIQPWVYDERSERYLRRNQPPFFGADIKMKF